MVPAPKTLLGSLSSYPTEDLTLHIGTQFLSPDLQLNALLTSPDSEKFLADLATLVAHRGVVFFKAQDISPAELKVLGQRLGEAGGKPGSSGLHRHPISESASELGDEVSIISSEGGIARQGYVKNKKASSGWHTDITFEPVPSDFTLLKMHTLPPVGGDTLWASGYEAYDRMSPAMQRFLETLTAFHDGSTFNEYADAHKIPILTPRGSPENAGSVLTATHPVIRTHAITGYKSLFVNYAFTKKIVELSDDESDTLLDYLFRHIAENHDLQVRYRWGQNDLAIWDNRCTFHTATFDYNDKRVGDRVVSIGEKPFFDPNSKSRREVLNIVTL